MEYVAAKSIITKTKHPEYWFGTEYNMNIYRGCCHDCIYCDSRSECYGIDDFHTVKAKENALSIIRDELRRKTKTGLIGTGAMSDPYNPFEKEMELTRHALELVNAYGFGICIATKGDLITRDIDILKDIREHSPAVAKITITTMDDSISKKVEPNAPVSSKRWEAVSKLTDAGITTGILMMPILPFIEDSEENILGIVRKAHEMSVTFIYPAMGMTLRGNQRDYYYNKLQELFPDENYVDMYRERFGQYYECRANNSSKLYNMFKKECEKYGILYNMKDIIHSYKKQYGYEQFSLFE